MTIHVVQPGETIESIADLYGINVDILIRDNGLDDPAHLVIGQTIVIVYPEVVHIVEKGDTFQSIVEQYQITYIDLLRNNPFLADADYIYPGERLVISYEKTGITLTMNGFTYPFINEKVLRKTLPFLTYLSVFSYKVNLDGTLIDIDDQEIINLAKAYGVAPIMVLSTVTGVGEESIDITPEILSSTELQQKIIQNTLNVMETEGYYGLNLYIQYVTPENLRSVEEYINLTATELNARGYPLFVTITPSSFLVNERPQYELIDFSRIGEYANKILLLSYQWGFSYGPPAAVTDLTKVRQFFNYIANQVPGEKLILGFPVIGYDWELPYVEGTRANSLSTNAAIKLAREVGAVILFDEETQAPYFTYRANNENGEEVDHIVWFKDARSIESLVSLAIEYNFDGVGIWNIMQYFDQLWLIVNSQYNITRLEI